MENLSLIQFSGVQIEATFSDGVPFANLRRMCETLGLNYAGQTQRLERSEWACVCKMHTHDSSGRTQEMAFISADTIPMWLATIQVNRVAESLRPALRVYQLEARDVLYKHFAADSQGIAVNGRPIAKLESDIVVLQEQMTGIVRQMASHQEKWQNLFEKMFPIIQRIDERTAAKREHVPLKIKKQYVRLVSDRYKGMCPCCQSVKIVSDLGERVPDLSQIDHFHHRSMNRREHCWLVCKRCNRKLRDRKPNGYWFQSGPAFQQFQRLLHQRPEQFLLELR